MAKHHRQQNGLIVASNRLPVSVSLGRDGVQLEQSAGGLAAALRGLENLDAWVGWPGTVVPDESRQAVRDVLAAEGLKPVFLSAEEQEEFYRRICNEAIWPLFHYLPARFDFKFGAWEHYVAVNERFAEAIADACKPDARVWVHDFHLMLVPEILRRLRPDLSIGFFLHVPFPSSEIYRLLPVREQVLRGLLGADYVGFHTGDYARHFRSSCLRILGIESQPDAIEFDGRLVGIGVDPIGIDVAGFRKVLDDPETARVLADLEERYEGRRLILGVERLDYTKGIPQKLRAFEQLLERHPERAADTTLVQVLMPSRLESPEYLAQRDEIELLVSHVNGRFGLPGRTPVEYFHRNISPAELAALYRRADVMAVTPLRDGMNLVAQEFVLCQAARVKLPSRWRGSLVLSEFAGAAHILPGAVLVNPWDTDDIVRKFLQALELDQDERRRRLILMSGRVEQLDSPRWAAGFLGRLRRFARQNRRARHVTRPLGAADRARLSGRFAEAAGRTVILDYDGTLRELANHPELAGPTPEITELLERLAALPMTDVHVVSGRKRRTLDSWFGTLPIHLCAEHGYFAREPDGVWRTLFDVDLSWLPRIERMLKRVAADVPGTFVERKTASVAWHYRQAEPEYGAWRARELLLTVERLLRGTPAEILRGRRVIEVRASGVNKGAYVRQALLDVNARSRLVFAAGDDQTDLDVHAALPAGAVYVHLGPPLARPRGGSPCETFSLESPQLLRELLGELAAAAESNASPPARAELVAGGFSPEDASLGAEAGPGSRAGSPAPGLVRRPSR